VLAVDRVAPPDEGPIRGATWARVDVRDLETMTRLLDRARVEALVHLAAIPSPRLGSPLEVFTTNTQATFAVLEAAGIAGVRRVAIASSTSVTGLPFASPPISPLYVPVDEEHPNVGSDPYALSKETDEATARTMHRRHGYQVVALRISNTAPMAEQQAKAAEVARDPSDLACELWAYLDIRDGARAFRQAVERGVPGCHVINVMAPDTYSAEPTAELLARYHPSAELRRPIVGREVPFDLARSRDLLGFSAEHRLPR
ncbi:MAG: NAD-dependent epimerase/dehydratase family protein, partial [Candidatus Limnocylindrales bacterium]